MHPNVVQSFLSGKDVDDMQDELKSLLFGEDDNRTFENATLELEESDYDYDVAGRRSDIDDEELPIAVSITITISIEWQNMNIAG